MPTPRVGLFRQCIFESISVVYFSAFRSSSCIKFDSFNLFQVLKAFECFFSPQSAMLSFTIA